MSEEASRQFQPEGLLSDVAIASAGCFYPRTKGAGAQLGFFSAGGL